MYYPREREPKTLAEAVVYATYYYADSGWLAFVSGWCYGHDMAPEELAKVMKLGRPKLIEWANREIQMEFKMGETVEITTPGIWKGLRATVDAPNRNDPEPYVRLMPDTERPDGMGYADFLWTKENVRKINVRRG